MHDRLALLAFYCKFQAGRIPTHPFMRERGDWIGNVIWLGIWGIGTIGVAYLILVSLDTLNHRSLLRLTTL